MKLAGRGIGWLGAALAVAALTLSACGSDEEPSGSGGGEDSFGEISMQYSWIKNEEFAGEFYATENGYYDEAGFDAVNGISGPDTGVAKLLSGTVRWHSATLPRSAPPSLSRTRR